MRNALKLMPILILLAAGLLRAAVQVGDTLHLNMVTTTGLRVTTAELKGHLLVVDFWATWCHPCMTQVPHIVKLYKKYSPDGVGFLGVSLDHNLAQMRAVARANSIVWPQVLQGQGFANSVARQWGVNAIPAAFLLGPDGEVLWKGYPSGLGRAISQGLKKYPTRAILVRRGGKIIASATKLLTNHRLYRQAIQKLHGLPKGLSVSARLQKPVKNLLWNFHQAGQPAVIALLADKSLTQRLAALVGTMSRLRELLQGFR